MWTLTLKFDKLSETLTFGHIYSFNTKRGKAFIFHILFYIFILIFYMCIYQGEGILNFVKLLPNPFLLYGN